MGGIDLDRGRFRDRVLGKIKNNLRRHISNTKLINEGKFSIPVEEIPRFRFKPLGGVAQGNGDLGDRVSPGQDSEDRERILETDINLEDVAKLLAEELELPFLTRRAGDLYASQKTATTKISKRGTVRRKKRSYINALSRVMASGMWDPDNPIVIPEGREWDYIHSVPIPHPTGKAVIFLIMDVSGSMGEKQKQIARTQFTYYEMMLRQQYRRDLEVRYLIHSGYAEETSRERFYRISNKGGTVISSAYELCDAIIDREYPPSEWDIYPVHITDGDNMDFDNMNALSWLRQRIIPKSKVVCYGQCPSAFITTDKLFLEYILGNFGLLEDCVLPKLRLAKINNDLDHLPVLRTFLTEKAHPLYNVE